jgi:hypothetical protein
MAVWSSLRAISSAVRLNCPRRRQGTPQAAGQWHVSLQVPVKSKNQGKVARMNSGIGGTGMRWDACGPASIHSYVQLAGKYFCTDAHVIQSYVRCVCISPFSPSNTL